jgi:hypothetical protein
MSIGNRDFQVVRRNERTDGHDEADIRNLQFCEGTSKRRERK